MNEYEVPDEVIDNEAENYQEDIENTTDLLTPTPPSSDKFAGKGFLDYFEAWNGGVNFTTLTPLKPVEVKLDVAYTPKQGFNSAWIMYGLIGGGVLAVTIMGLVLYKKLSKGGTNLQSDYNDLGDNDHTDNNSTSPSIDGHESNKDASKEVGYAG